MWGAVFIPPGPRHPDRTHPHAVSALGSGPDGSDGPAIRFDVQEQFGPDIGPGSARPAVAGRACPVIGQSVSVPLYGFFPPIPGLSPVPPKPRFDKSS